MSDYSIMMLDANEITNQVDISLKDYSDDNIESIKAAVLSHGGKTDYLNFIDDSNKVIRSTVGYETDNNASPFSLYGGNPASFTAKASTTRYLTGGKILIGNGYYVHTVGEFFHIRSKRVRKFKYQPTPSRIIGNVNCLIQHRRLFQ